jgi:hypothetical protein
MSVRVILVPYDSAYCRKRMGCGPDRVFASLKELLSGMKIPFDHEEISLESVYPAARWPGESENVALGGCSRLCSPAIAAWRWGQ